MRKVKPTIGAWAICDDPDGVYPYLNAFPIAAISEDRRPKVYWGGQNVTVVEKFCVSAVDGSVIDAEITQLSDRYKRARETLETTMASLRKRSVLGQLDPRP